MGFGHRVYRAEDPRARVLRRTAHEIGAPRVEVAEALEKAALAELQARKPDRVLATNVEFWSAVVLDFAEVPPELFTPMFTCARTAGWSAHIMEQKREGRLIRPTAKYVGPAPRPLSDLQRLTDSQPRGGRRAPYAGRGQPHDPPNVSSIPRRSAITSTGCIGRLEPLRLTRGGRGPRAGDVCARAAQAALPALRGRPRLSAAGAAQHVLQPAAHRRAAPADHRAARRPRPGRGPHRRSRPEARIESAELYAAISALPDDFRDALVAIDVVGLSYREAAQALRVREATITTRLHRARQRVASALAAGRQSATRPSELRTAD